MGHSNERRRFNSMNCRLPFGARAVGRANRQSKQNSRFSLSTIPDSNPIQLNPISRLHSSRQLRLTSANHRMRRHSIDLCARASPAPSCARTPSQCNQRHWRARHSSRYLSIGLPASSTSSTSSPRSHSSPAPGIQATRFCLAPISRPFSRASAVKWRLAANERTPPSKWALCAPTNGTASSGGWNIGPAAR